MFVIHKLVNNILVLVSVRTELVPSKEQNVACTDTHSQTHSKRGEKYLANLSLITEFHGSPT